MLTKKSNNKIRLSHHSRKSTLSSPSKQTTVFKKFIIILCSISATAMIVYFGFSFFFTRHLFFNTYINNTDFSLNSAADVNSYIKRQIDNYSLTIKIDGQTSAEITGDSVSLQCAENSIAEKMLKSQNVFLWPASLFAKTSQALTIPVRYDKSLLEKKIEELQLISPEQIPSENAKPEYNGDIYVVKPEVIGTSIDLDVLTEKINLYLSKQQTILDAAAEHCYTPPKYTSSSPEVQAACDTMNNYIKTSITYPMNENVVIDKALIPQWLTVSENLEVTINSDAIKTWLAEFGDKYDTLGSTRTFTTPTGKNAAVAGGTYGWSIDEDTELTNILNSIKNGEIITREPAYYIGGTAAVHQMPDWGNTFVEVDLSEQHMWYFADGALALETDVITGEPIPERITPEGTYFISEKLFKTTLVGAPDESGNPQYRTPVDYWMRITAEGIGFHDAWWQTGFGGTLYQTHGIGSHGCINMPVGQAAALYSMIEAGTPAIIHY